MNKKICLTQIGEYSYNTEKHSADGRPYCCIWICFFYFLRGGNLYAKAKAEWTQDTVRRFMEKAGERVTVRVKTMVYNT
jgi:hypothetical protein